MSPSGRIMEWAGGVPDDRQLAFSGALLAPENLPCQILERDIVAAGKGPEVAVGPAWATGYRDGGLEGLAEGG